MAENEQKRNFKKFVKKNSKENQRLELNLFTVYLALHTGDEVVMIFSALLGLLMQKYFTVPS